MGGSGRRESDAVVHTGTLREMVADVCDGVLMGGMSRVGSHVIKGVDASGQTHVPFLGGIFVDAYFNGLQFGNHVRQLNEGLAE